MNRALLKIRLVQKESDKRYPYDDATGKLVTLPTGGKLTIGVGRNLNAKPLSNAIVQLMLDEDIDDAEAAARQYAWYDGLTDARQRAVVEMIFNLGPVRFAGFKRAIAYLAAGMYAAAADEIVDSKAAKQTGNRYLEIAAMVRNG